ncbi:hypothetical protein FRC00_005083 [Tulasnella sp. 408]|nr:hypothetical protein FRC00_005083 [Tulasnella sp. 408]
MFSAYSDELYEQYLDHTVLTGLTKTGHNNTNPFGRIASTVQGDTFRKNLRQKYPGIDAEDPKQRIEGTCAFLHDFILDLRPLNIRPTYVDTGSTRNGTEDVGAGDEKDIEAAQGTPAPQLH